MSSFINSFKMFVSVYFVFIDIKIIFCELSRLTQFDNGLKLNISRIQKKTRNPKTYGLSEKAFFRRKRNFNFGAVHYFSSFKIVLELLTR